MSPLPETFIDGMMPHQARIRRIRSRVMRQAEEILTVNIEKIRWALFQSIQSEFRRINEELDIGLEAEINSIRNAIVVVMDKKKASEVSINEEKLRLQEAKSIIDKAAAFFETPREGP